MADTLTQAAFARLLGVRRQVVHKWVKAGKIRLTDDGRIEPAAARARLAALESTEAHHRENRRRYAATRAGADAVPADPPFDDEAHRLAELRATLALRENQAALAAMKVERLAASLVARADVEAVLAEFARVVAEELQALPARLAPEIAAHHGATPAIHRTLEAAARETLHTVADRLGRLAQAEESPR